MSQIYKPTTSGSLPPTVATIYTTDDGVAVPASNNLNVLGNDTVANDTDGLSTMGSGSTVTVLLTNRISVSATTSDGGGQTQVVTLMTPTNSTSITFRLLVSGFDSANNETAGGELIGLARASAGVLTVVGSNDTFDESDPGLVAVDWDVIDTASPILQVQFVGVAGRSIAWRALFDYTQAP